MGAGLAGWGQGPLPLCACLPCVSCALSRPHGACMMHAWARDIPSWAPAQGHLRKELHHRTCPCRHRPSHILARIPAPPCRCAPCPIRRPGCSRSWRRPTRPWAQPGGRRARRRRRRSRCASDFLSLSLPSLLFVEGRGTPCRSASLLLIITSTHHHMLPGRSAQQAISCRPRCSSWRAS